VINQLKALGYPLPPPLVLECKSLALDGLPFFQRYGFTYLLLIFLIFVLFFTELTSELVSLTSEWKVA